MEWIFGIWSLLYIAFVVAVFIGWKQGRQDPMMDNDQRPFISLVISVRNEESNIKHLLQDMIRQEYPADLHEIIIVDDHSEDGTLELLGQWKDKIHNLKIYSNLQEDTFCTPKKSALTYGVKKAKGPWILMTDGDCRVGPYWVSSMARHMAARNPNFVAGPVKLEGGHRIWHQWQVLEFASLSGTAAGTINLGYPVFCNGANLGFRKAVFERVGGYDGNEDLASGDDVFLMQKIHRMLGGVTFVKDTYAIVRTGTLDHWREFFNQRVRWAGKWKQYTAWWGRGLPVFIFIYYTLMIVSAVMVFTHQFEATLFLMLLLLKIAVEWMFLGKVMAFYGEKFRLGIFLVSSIFYAFYALAFGVFANIAGFKWKGRNYSQ